MRTALPAFDFSFPHFCWVGSNFALADPADEDSEEKPLGSFWECFLNHIIYLLVVSLNLILFKRFKSFTNNTKLMGRPIICMDHYKQEYREKSDLYKSVSENELKKIINHYAKALRGKIEFWFYPEAQASYDAAREELRLRGLKV